MSTNKFKYSVLSKDISILSEESSDEVEKSENGTQTIVYERGKGKSRRYFEKYISKGKQITPRNKLKRKQLFMMDWKRFHKLDSIYRFMDNLERDYPAICTVSVIGKSVEGRDIKMIKISNSNASNPAVWLDASIHSREWISTAVVTYLANFIVKNFKDLSCSIKNKDWYIVPVLNPDGYEHTHTRDRMWRKNRARHDGVCVGVDLNRNFSYGWGNNGEEGSSEDPNNVFYRGPAPFSEPETAAVRDTILSSSTTFKVFLSFHSYYELIIFPWGYKTNPCPDYLNLLEGGAIMARVTAQDTSTLMTRFLDHTTAVITFYLSKIAIYETSGLIYKVGCTKDLTYYACGTSIDWSYGIAKIPYSYMVELRSKKYRFKLPKDQIEETCVEIWNAVKNLMDYIDEPLRRGNPKP